LVEVCRLAGWSRTYTIIRLRADGRRMVKVAGRWFVAIPTGIREALEAQKRILRERVELAFAGEDQPGGEAGVPVAGEVKIIP
jgi:hypothetical protein